MGVSEKINMIFNDRGTEIDNSLKQETDEKIALDVIRSDIP